MADQHLFLNQFQSKEIDSHLLHRISGKSYKENEFISLDSLRYLSIPHYDFSGAIKMGELIVHKDISKQTLSVFQDLFQVGYPIEKLLLIDNYNGDDYQSMSDNNSSAFNYRFIDGTTTLSDHSFGLAIDINPLYNPYIKEVNGTLKVLPPEGSLYVNRNIDCPYIIKENDICHRTFLKHGFLWGGSWNHAKDYQHFYYKL